MQLSQSCKYSESTDLLRKSLLPHVFTICQYSHLYVGRILDTYGLLRCHAAFAILQTFGIHGFTA